MPLYHELVVYSVLIVATTEGFQWTATQQASDMISVVAGSSVTLPCKYELTPQEEKDAKDFNMITWTREVPQGSGNWLGLTIKSSLLGTQVLADDPSHISLNGTALALSSVTERDFTRYQCAFQSSFLTTPFTIQLNVQCKYNKFLQQYLSVMPTEFLTDRLNILITNVPEARSKSSVRLSNTLIIISQKFSPFIRNILRNTTCVALLLFLGQRCSTAT